MKKSKKQKLHRARRSRRRVAAEQGIESNALSGDAPPHLTFLTRFNGSLPETIAESDLETLNSGLGFLFARLREARKSYHDQKDGGRAEAVTALGAIWQFIMLFKTPRAELLHAPIHRLQAALVALDQNNVSPILKPLARPGRAPSSDAYAALQGHAAGTVMRLRKTGLNPTQAYTLVAKDLAKLGVRPQRGSDAVTANTVRHWCDEVANDVGRRGTAATVYDPMFTAEENTRFDALPPLKPSCLLLLRYACSSK